MINQARLAQGLSPLSPSAELAASAQAHAQDMVKYGYMEHEGRDGSTPQTRATRQGYVAPSGTAWLVLEVISARQTAEAAVNWLLSDRLHRGVLLRGYWREFGVGYAEGGPWGQIWTVEFGCRPNVLPVVADTPSSGGTRVYLTNEECTPGGTPDAIGKATEVMVSNRADFSGAAWEPFVTSKVVKSDGNVFVKYRDARGRETLASTAPGGNAAILSAASASTTTLNSATPPTGEPGLFTSASSSFEIKPSSTGR
ncbi:MAG: CAP domain-containing protein [Chloroflexi bacterium]|nr:CAP domain-containing protein [Chloroflexota bacterium]